MARIVTHRGRLAILGASGHGKVVGDAALLAGWEPVVFFDDGWPAVSAIGPWPVIGGTAELLKAAAQYEGAVVAIGDNSTRLRKQRELTDGRVILASIIHPASVVSRFAEIGADTVIFAGAVVNAFARLGPGCIVNTCASIDHDCELDGGVHVSPGAHLGGGVRVGEAAWIGIGAAVRQGISIGARVIVGAGAVVVSDLADGQTVIGAPARPLRVSGAGP